MTSKVVKELKKLYEENPEAKKVISGLFRHRMSTEYVTGDHVIQAVKFMEEHQIDPKVVHVEFDLPNQRMAIIDHNDGEVIWRTDLQ